ncbi:hypothetical protein [Kitasatospora terrestris]|uniref:DUF35 domain-containing protein n=1 Tax=Kitasatospora terrestris TaxID=258051 RepID=A0ABP9EUN1_9ACTN
MSTATARRRDAQSNRIITPTPVVPHQRCRWCRTPHSGQRLLCGTCGSADLDDARGPGLGRIVRPDTADPTARGFVLHLLGTPAAHHR